MTEARPFKTVTDLLETAEHFWWSLKSADWLEAFRSHPRIGEKKAEIQHSAAAQKWSQQEQSGVGGATDDTLQALVDGNREYHERFGFIFIVCASGKSAEEMLSLLKNRLGNEKNEELKIAAAEQAAITKLRLEKLLTQ